MIYNILLKITRDFASIYIQPNWQEVSARI